VQQGFAVRQREVFKNVIIGVYCANGFIVLASIVGGIVIKKHKERKFLSGAQ